MSGVYVVSFAPSSEHHGVGGFEWYVDPITAELAYKYHVMESARYGGSHIVRLVTVEVSDDFDMTDAKDRAEITSVIDSVWLDHIESYLAPIRQYVPACTEPGRIPENARVIR